MKRDDLIIEIHTEELPPKALTKLADAFCQQMKDRLEKAGLAFANIKSFATPRRLAVFVAQLASSQPDQVVERKGPALNAAFDASGKPTQACIGFARSCGVTPEQLAVIKTPQGEWMGYSQSVTGKSVNELLPSMVEEAVQALPIPKRMRWGSSEIQFVRPVHAVMMLYGDQVINASILGLATGQVTRGHRFLAPEWITVPSASHYESLLEKKGYVIADINVRRDKILELAADCVNKSLGNDAAPQIDEALLTEVAGLVEWPVALCGRFDEAFLAVPQEVLISAMQDHQRYFPVVDQKGKLLPNFVTISNIVSRDPARVVQGNERVLRARLSDAAFFYKTDQQESLLQRVERLRGIVYQAKLGTLYDKADRLSRLTSFVALRLGADNELASLAGMLAKTDLTTNMVGEFPELQGVMGCYYARIDGQPEAVAAAMKEQYLPRYAGDALPATPIGQALALSDRLDTLIGAFGINQIPTGDKDPYGLRRAAIGVLRILIENQIDLDLKEALEFAFSCYEVTLDNSAAVTQVLGFMQERLRALYLEQGVASDVFASVAALGITNPLDCDKRIQAVRAFKLLNEAEALSVANKRVSNILAKYTDKIDSQMIDAAFFESDAEKILAQQLEKKSQHVAKLSESGQYADVLLQLAELRQPVDDFFDQVMVMTDDKPRRENRLLMLSKLRALFLQVADIALLQ